VTWKEGKKALMEGAPRGRDFQIVKTIIVNSVSEGLKDLKADPLHPCRAFSFQFHEAKQTQKIENKIKTNNIIKNCFQLIISQHRRDESRQRRMLAKNAVL